MTSVLNCYSYRSLFIVLFCAIINLHVTSVDCQSDELRHAVHDFVDSHVNGSGVNLDEWDAPAEMKKDLVYYHSGFDDESRPVWVAEWGKWDIKKYTEGTPEQLRDYDLYTDQFMVRILQSVIKVYNQGTLVDGIHLLIDVEGYGLDQLSSLQSVLFNLRKIASWFTLIEGIYKGYIVNTNFIAERMINLAKPALGRNFDRFEVYGTNKDKWIPRILKEIPKSQLPAWYGGVKDFKPLSVHG